MCEFLAVSRRRTRRVGRAEGREFLLAQMCLPGTNDLRSERLGMGPREYCITIVISLASSRTSRRGWRDFLPEVYLP